MLAPSLALLLSPGASAQDPPGTPGGEAEDVAGVVPAEDVAGDVRVLIAVLPYGTSVERIAAEPELAPGVVSAGLGSVPVAQTFLDIGQGNRVNQTLYDGDLPRLYLRDGEVPPRLWQRVIERAESAPAKIVPGLLASTVLDAGLSVRAEVDSGLSTLTVVDRNGEVLASPRSQCERACPAGLTMMRALPGELSGLLDSLGPNDLLIALAAGARGDQVLLPVGFAGPGFAGNLTSASTRTDGVITTTDLAPTILDAFGVDVPDEINGSVVTSAGDRDPAEVADLQDQLESRPSRVPVALAPLGIWLVLTALASILWRRRGARVALGLLGPAAAIAPAMLLLAAAFDTSTLASALLVAIGSPALALAAVRSLGHLRALALACAITVGAYAVDVVVGSPLTALSVLGPNPGYGVRFFGIGNELEAILTALALVGTGAGLASAGALASRTVAITFVAVAALATLAFAPGRFGADVGAAIVLGAGAGTAAVLALGIERRKAIAIVVGGGVLALASLFAIDLVLGGAHLSRSVLGAGDAGDVADVFTRRLRLMSDTFIHPVYPELLAASALLLVAAIVRRRTVLAWFGDPRGPAACGFLGAAAGVLVGTFANDSGSVLLVLGTIYLAITAGFFWAAREARALPDSG